MIKNENYLTIFHEIKNSITLINSSLQLVAKKHPEVIGFDYWNETISEIGFLKNMVTQLSSSRLGDNLNLTEVDLKTYMPQIMNSAYMLSSDDFHCELFMEEHLPPVMLDQQLLRQAIVNLIKNAYEAMQETGTVKINVTFSDNWLRIAIVDSGGGLDPAMAESVFEPFITSKTGGSGLGLSITQKIIESHQGMLTCDSRPGDGCTFTILLPPMQN